MAAQIAVNNANRELLARLDEINGQDAYSTVTATIGRLNRTEYLRLPEGMDIPARGAELVGSGAGAFALTSEIAAQVYALNKAVAPQGVDAVRFGLLRMLAVQTGWHANQTEVVRVPQLPDANATFAADLGPVVGEVELARQAAFLVPLAAEFVFRTTGHHYITGQAAAYEAKYQKVFASALAPNVHGYLAGPVLYHTALHWVGPARARAVLTACLADAGRRVRIPDSLALRADAAPAGTAVVTTTAAVLDTLEAQGLLGSLSEASGMDLAMVRAVATEVRANPVSFHKAWYAYAVPRAPVEAVARLEAAASVAARFAPIAQGYIDAALGDAALSRAMALKKHAADNPIQMARAHRFFRALSRKEVVSVADLFPRSA